MAEHAGLPVLGGTEVVLSCWIRASPMISATSPRVAEVLTDDREMRGCVKTRPEAITVALR
jgi:hypothetical protein